MTYHPKLVTPTPPFIILAPLAVIPAPLAVIPAKAGIPLLQFQLVFKNLGSRPRGNDGGGCGNEGRGGRCDNVMQMQFGDFLVRHSAITQKPRHQLATNHTGSTCYQNAHIYFPQCSASGLASRASSKRPLRVSRCKGRSGWRTWSDLITPPAIITALAERKPHWRFS